MARITPPSRFEDAVHFIGGMSAGGTVRMCRARDFIIIHDLLSIGPCDVNPARHVEKRRKAIICFQRGYVGPDVDKHKEYLAWEAKNLISAKELVKKLCDSHKPIVLWTSSAFPDRLNLWWALDALQRASLNGTQIWLAEPRLRSDYPVSSLGVFNEEEFQTAFANLQPLRKKVADSGATLWRKFAAKSPLAFDAARRKGARAFPDLKVSSEVFGAVFPQRVGRKLRLSKFDQAILDAARRDQWRRPVDLFRANNFETLFLFGDMHFAHRLQEWARHSPTSPVLLAKTEPKAVSSFTAVSYQLTEHGKKLRDEGLENPTDAPPFFMGGWVLYSDDPTWVRRNRGQEWWIEAFQR